MGNKIRRCFECKIYTLDNNCPKCGLKTKNPGPSKFSPKDPYGKYRRKGKYKGVE
ncbi:RNA-protein complex protein Nop10 [Methanosalsum natronophilum]|uniref:Ribosome biogenesis protein Nop10 n=1 Tax=Methanosalsum natronophilum TaxID=768733 RepID=A0A3R8CDD6_9EURY|nr:RNA-protein complex protein Nop10 [Methanosalsum natronophilum]MCS3923112.1 H/ACA ribonucleoprotein complex subunit 3 [Methanosalsum natronophilum]RQD88375.1 MAG: RNA-protein complex protein Nop10 [Methanosalsum natronophilum]